MFHVGGIILPNLLHNFNGACYGRTRILHRALMYFSDTLRLTGSEFGIWY